jgi:hypothetical protein
MSLNLQDLAVTGAAACAAGLFVYRLVGSRRRSSGGSCASCASGQPCAPDKPAAAPTTVHPLSVIKPSLPK